MDMGHTGAHYLHLAFLMTTVCSLLPGTKTNHTHVWANATVWDSVTPNRDRNHHENISTSPVTPEENYKENSTNIPAPATSSHNASFTPKSEPKLYVTIVRTKPTTQSTENTSKNHSEIVKKDVCEENNNMAVLICLIIIAVLFLICTLLFLSTVVLANKVSSLRRSKQAGKRQPRSNGDFLASSGLWPADSDTWKRAKQVAGPNLMMQSTGMLAATMERKDEGTEKLTNRCFSDERHSLAMKRAMEQK
ncbi:protein EVI2A [Ochotona curzoniae]|uniref:protein EVI2A n=1 Tax=Ochotona curzoniae TaxID=130825 RepID=UPI001B34F86A|nr:protein EVI2A [Ochotona curzoniae]